MGQFKRAFDLFELTSSADLSIIERDGRIAGLSDCTGVGRVCTYGRMISSLGYGGRDQGVRVEASGDRVAFRGTVTNGTGANNSDENDAKSFSGRLSFDATDMVTVSGQFGVHDYVEDGSDEYANAWGIDAQYGGMRGRAPGSGVTHRRRQLEESGRWWDRIDLHGLAGGRQPLYATRWRKHRRLGTAASGEPGRPRH